MGFSHIEKDRRKCTHYRYIDINIFTLLGNILRKYYHKMNFAGVGVQMARHLTLNLALGNTCRLDHLLIVYHYHRKSMVMWSSPVFEIHV